LPFAQQPLLRRESWRDGLEIRWFNAGGGPQQAEQWDEGSTLGVSISRPDLRQEDGIWHDVLMLFNPFEGTVPFQIPQFGEGDGCWSCLRQMALPPGQRSPKP
jgi:glycogen operon protein